MMAVDHGSSLLIREAQPGDISAVVAYNAALALETERKVLDPAVLTRGVERALADPDRLRYWVVEIDGLVIGQSAVTREWSDWRDGWVWWLQSVYIEEPFRGQGVFRSLYRHIRDAALAERDVIGLRLYVEHENARAQATYQALGLLPGGYHVYEQLWIERFNRADG